jgi:NitT/TauT family transport system substrate-binding protein
MAFSCITAMVPNDSRYNTAPSSDGLTELVIAEPFHGTGYLPLYVGMREGFFADEGIKVELMTLQGGSTHTNAVLTGDAWAFIGGPEHNAFAKTKGAELRAIAHIVDRGNVYLVAGHHLNNLSPNVQPDLAVLLRGKRIAVSHFGGTPNSILRYILSDQGLDPRQDVVLIEGDHSTALASMKMKQADFAITTEPTLTQGIRQKIWGEPIYNIPQELGSYAFSTINIRKESIEQDPQTVERFIRAFHRSIRFVYSNPDKVAEVAAKEFPNMAKDDLNATLGRAFADQLWSLDGMLKPEAWDTAHRVVRKSNILKEDVTYNDIVDMQFMESVTAQSSP